MNLIVTESQVRDYLELNSPGSSSKYSDQTIASNLRAAQSFLESATHRFLFDHPAVTWARTSMLQAQVALPGFRAFTTVTWGGSVMTVGYPGNDTNASCWVLAEEGPGVEFPLYVGMQFRPWRVDNDRPWWLADSQWFDKALDSPFYPGNWGGGYAWTSMPNDLVIVGDGGYAAGTEPEALKHAIKVLASFYTMRPASILADVAITPQGGVLTYSQLPTEAVAFIRDWKIGRQVQSM